MLRSFLLLVGWVVVSGWGVTEPALAQPGASVPAPPPRVVMPVRAAAAVDTVRLTLAQAEQRFLAGNFQLLAQRYNVTAARAQILQARL